jgi:hypothetical protein
MSPRTPSKLSVAPATDDEPPEKKSQLFKRYAQSESGSRV